MPDQTGGCITITVTVLYVYLNVIFHRPLDGHVSIAPRLGILVEVLVLLDCFE